MLNDSDQLQSDMDAPIVDGTPVYDASGDKIGDVVEHNDQGGYMTLQKGWLFPKDVYVPVSAIQRKTTDGIYLSMTKDQLQSQNWENPPGFVGDNRDINESYTTDTMASGTTSRGTLASDVRDQAASRDDGDIAVPVREEELTATKTPYEADRVHVNRDVVEEQENVNVPVTHEEVRVDRVPVQGNASDVGPEAFTDKDIDVPLMGEQVQTEKQARVNEELRLHKRAVTENQPVSDTVRKERVNVEGLDDQGRVPLDDTSDYSDDETTQKNLP